jgi:ribosomal protein S18 acetylase RimI-like enzyme
MRDQDQETLRSYFGYPIGDDGFKQLMCQILDKSQNHEFVVAEDSNKEVVGILHVARMNADTAEFAIAVRKDLRKQGIGDQMMQLAKLHCRNRGFKNVGMYYVNENLPVAKLAMKHGLGIYRKNRGDDFAFQDLAAPTPVSMWLELMLVGMQEYQSMINAMNPAKYFDLTR